MLFGGLAHFLRPSLLLSAPPSIITFPLSVSVEHGYVQVTNISLHDAQQRQCLQSTMADLENLPELMIGFPHSFLPLSGSLCFMRLR